jgi:aspartyl-tRNA(Asn)/glutamyl-tRNA(Gln) amidotransferase subunit C
MEIKDVENLAELAKIDLTQIEKEKLLKDMDGILSYVKQIEEVEVPDFDIVEIHRNQFREDEILEKDFDKEQILAQFPDRYENFVKVKKIL